MAGWLGAGPAARADLPARRPAPERKWQAKGGRRGWGWGWCFCRLLLPAFGAACCPLLLLACSTASLSQYLTTQLLCLPPPLPTEVYVWGRGEYGRLGLGDRTGSSKLRPQKVAALDGHRVVEGSCGGTHTMVVTDEGRCFIWGRGAFGRCAVRAGWQGASGLTCL